LTVLTYSLKIKPQTLCLEERIENGAIISDLFMNNGECYLTLDIVKFSETISGGITVENLNPKLRTFKIEPQTAWELCILGERHIFKICELIKQRELIFNRQMYNRYITFSAKGGVIIESKHFCGAID